MFLVGDIYTYVGVIFYHQDENFYSYDVTSYLVLFVWTVRSWYLTLKNLKFAGFLHLLASGNFIGSTTYTWRESFYSTCKIWNLTIVLRRGYVNSVDEIVSTWYLHWWLYLEKGTIKKNDRWFFKNVSDYVLPYRYFVVTGCYCIWWTIQ
jgi:hypothetical protein